MMADTRIIGAKGSLIISGSGTITLMDNRTGQEWVSATPGIGVAVSGPDGDLYSLGTVRIKERKIGIAGAVLTVLATNEANGGQDLLIKLEVVLSDYFSSKVRSVEGLAKGQSISIDFPARLGAAKADDPGYLVMPCGVGVMCNFSGRRNSLRFERLIYSGGQMGYAMPLFGVVKNDQAMAGIVQTPFDCMLKTWINDGKEGEYSITPCWLFEEGRLDYEREVRYYLLGKAGYVEIAKTYREYVITAGKYKSFCGKN